MIFLFRGEAKSTLYLFLLRKNAKICIAAKAFQLKRIVLFCNRVCNRISYRKRICQTLSQVPYKVFQVYFITYLMSGYQCWTIKPFLITCNALNCIFKGEDEKNKNKTQENVLKVFFVVAVFVLPVNIMCLAEKGKTSFEHSWCMLHVLLFKWIFNDFQKLIKDGNKCKKGFLETQ